MGSWSTSITGNDTAQDLKNEYLAAFSRNDTDTALQKIDSMVRQDFDESDEEEWCNYIYSLADFMWKHGILTDAIRDSAVTMIDTGFGLEIWEESGSAILKQREKALAQFREKLLSPQPPAKKIRLKLHLKPIFETGDLIAVRLKTRDRCYVSHSRLSEEEFRGYHGKYVVLRKAGDHNDRFCSVEPEIRNYWAVFQLYKKIFDTCPTVEELEGIPFCTTRDNDTFTSESSLFPFRKREYRIIGRDSNELPRFSRNGLSFVFWSIDKPWINPENTILEAILHSNQI